MKWYSRKSSPTRMLNTEKVSIMIDASINLGSYQSIKIGTSISRDIQYSTEEERLAIEAKLRSDSSDALKKAAYETLTKMGKDDESFQKWQKDCRERLTKKPEDKK